MGGGGLIIIEKSKICSWCTPILQHLVIIISKFKDSQSKFVALFAIKCTYSNYIIIQHGVELALATLKLVIILH